jgi:hypothetical protein
LFEEDNYKERSQMSSVLSKDGDHKRSAFYIRDKIEIGTMAKEVCPSWIRVLMISILVIYMYGAMCLKYVSGADSFV